MSDDHIGSTLTASVDNFRSWWDGKQKDLDISQKVAFPFFHYTDANGILGIIRNQEIWYTSIFHLNDPGELAYGVEIELGIIHDEWKKGGKIVRLFCECLDDMLRKNIGGLFGFYVASFSRLSDDLGQWRAYADNGRGFAIGIAPHLFHINRTSSLNPNQIIFVSEIEYDQGKIEDRHREAIRRAIEIIEREFSAGTIEFEPVRLEFQRNLSIELAAPLLWYSITAKHSAYKNEKEVRLMMVNAKEELTPYVDIRTRGSNLVPFIRSPLPLRPPGSISEIVIGPSATDFDAEDAIYSLLITQNFPDDIPLRRSSIPYRAQ